MSPTLTLEAGRTCGGTIEASHSRIGGKEAVGIGGVERKGGKKWRRGREEEGGNRVEEGGREKRKRRRGGGRAEAEAAKLKVLDRIPDRKCH